VQGVDIRHRVCIELEHTPVLPGYALVCFVFCLGALTLRSPEGAYVVHAPGVCAQLEHYAPSPCECTHEWPVLLLGLPCLVKRPVTASSVCVATKVTVPGMDVWCVSATHCASKKADGICHPECMHEKCGFDGHDCDGVRDSPFSRGISRVPRSHVSCSCQRTRVHDHFAHASAHLPLLTLSYRFTFPPAPPPPINPENSPRAHHTALPDPSRFRLYRARRGVED
jgi:hypothetical protein